MDKYFLIRKDQEKEREKYTQEVRRKMFIKNGEAKTLDSALLFSECLFERSQQKQYKDMLAEYERMADQKHLEEAKEKDRDQIQEGLDKVKEHIEKSAEHQKEILAQCVLALHLIKNKILSIKKVVKIWKTKSNRGSNRVNY